MPFKEYQKGARAWKSEGRDEAVSTYGIYSQYGKGKGAKDSAMSYANQKQEIIGNKSRYPSPS